nr:hypothetical protein [Spirochaetota bacterium]
MFFKNFFSIFFLFIVVSLFSQQIEYYGIVKSVKSFENRIPSVNYPDKQPQIIKEGDKITRAAVILTNEDQFVELALYNGEKSIGFISIKENSDISFGEKENVFEIKINYGRCRIFLNEKIKTAFITRDYKAEIWEKCDFGFEALMDGSGNNTGYFIVFEGSLNVESIKNKNFNRNIRKWEKQNFINRDLKLKEDFTEETLENWKQNMSFVSKSIPMNLQLVLEKLKFEEKEIAYEEEEIAEEEIKEEEIKKDLSNDVKPKEKYKIDKAQIAYSFLSFEIGSLWYNLDKDTFLLNNLGIKFVYRPGMSLFNDKFEYGLSFKLNIFPLKFQNSNLLEAFGYANPNSRWKNNEFSFGSDNYPNVGRMVFDIFDDIFSKVRIIRYNREEDKIFIKIGEFYSVNDDNNFILYDFNPQYYEYYQRKTSLYSNFNFGFFNAFLYAEDILPKGLYGTNFSVATPAKSFRVKFNAGTFFDCYDAVKFDGEKSLYPASFYSSLTLDTFNLPSFGLSFYLNGGVFVPLNSTTSNYEKIILSGLNFTFGAHIRFKDLLFSFEFTKDSETHKIGMYDFGYSYNRAKKIEAIYDYLDIAENRTDPNSFFEDHYFGFRAKMKAAVAKYFALDFSLQLGVSSKYPDHFGTDLLRKIYDKVYLKLIFDSLEKLDKVNINFYALWSVENIVESIMTNNINSSLIENNIAFAGLGVSPMKGIIINTVFGIHPISDKMLFSAEASLTIIPLLFPKK